MRDRRAEAEPKKQKIDPWSPQARLVFWDWTSEDETPVEQSYQPSHPGERSLSETVSRATGGKVRPDPEARVEIQGDEVHIFRHGIDTCPKVLQVGSVDIINFTKPKRGSVAVKVASVVRVGPNGEIARRT